MTDESPLLRLVRPDIRPLVAYAPPATPPPVKLDANESPWPLPREARERVAAAIAAIDTNRYPDARATELRAALARHHGGSPDDYVMGAGSDEVIALMMTALVQPRGERTCAAVLYPEPTFVMFRIAAITHGLEPVGVALDEQWQLDVEGMRAALSVHRPNLIFLATPNNPTGNAFRDEDLRAVIESDPRALFVIDEAYGPFGGRSLASWCDEYPNVAALGTLSKIGLAAARVGWCRLPPALAVEVDKARQPYNLSALAQTVAGLALGELAPVLRELVGRVISERQRLAEALGRFEALAPYPSQANFVLVRYEGDPDALSAGLRERGIAIKSLHGHGGRLRGHLRITVGTPQENDSLLTALGELL